MDRPVLAALADAHLLDLAEDDAQALDRQVRIAGSKRRAMNSAKV